MSSLAKDCDFSPYAQLVTALLPRASGMSLFVPTGELRWTNEEAIGPAASKRVMTSVAIAVNSKEAGERGETSEGYPLYLFWLRDEEEHLIAVFALSWRTIETEPRSFAFVQAMLRPVLECLRRELLLRAQCSGASNTAADDDADLKMLLSATAAEQQDDAGDGVRQLLQSVNRHLQCEFAALLVPERRMATVVKIEEREVDTSVLARIHRPLLSLAAVRSEAVLLNNADSLAGVALPMRVLSCPLRDRNGRFAGVLALLRTREAPEFRGRDAMLVELLARRAITLVESGYDSLTGLATRRSFEQRATAMLAQRHAAQNWSMLYIDTDRMQVINDNHGMHVGDALLARLGELIRNQLAPGALAARAFGSRFAMLLPLGEADATTFAETLRAGAAALTGAHVGVSDPAFQVSVSIGLAAVDARGVEAALAAAEAACRSAKQQGRNRVANHSDMDATISADDGIEAALRSVINNRLCLHAQRMTPLHGSGSTGYELLLRVLDDSGTAMGPGGFITAAARRQLLPEVDRWVVQAALQQLAPHAALLAAHPVTFAINLSGQALGANGLAEFIIEQIAASGVPPQALCFELTESIVNANAAAAQGFMQQLREVGCRIALDNFGTGMSSLALLRTLPVDMLKIDGCFVRDVLKDPRAASMVQAMTHLACGMQLVTVAQHVETEEIRQRMATLGVDMGQGFAIGRPAPLAEAISDLPELVAAASLVGEEIVLSGDGDDISAELQDELLAAGIEVSEADADAVARMQAVLANYDHSESTLYQPKLSS